VALLRAAALSGLVLTLASDAAAGPTIWQRARSPNAAAEARLLAALERTLDAYEQASATPALADNLARAAVAMAGLARIEDPEDPRLACLIARALLLSDHGRARDARRLLERALPKLPEGMLAARAAHALGLAHSILDDSVAARAAYTRALELAWDAETRAVAYCNRAEEYMRAGELERALADFRRAAALAREPHTQALARFGLALALERRLDLPSAYQELDRALAVVLPVPPYPTEDPLELPGLFYVPAHDRHYLDALVWMARARHVQGSVRQDAYSRAVSAWDAYLAAAPASERWYAQARAHRERCDRLSETSRR
jgi:tetratricopeptide (TPR) repeat protein